MPLRHYETAFTLTPVLSAKQMEDAVHTIKDLLNKQGAKIVHAQSHGLIPLAYPIQKKQTGFFYTIEFQAPPTAVGVLEKAYRYDDKVMRFLTFALDKHAVLYNAAKRKAVAQQQTSKTQAAHDGE